MPDSSSKTRKSSIADLMAKVPVNKGSLLASIENLLKTIESSESSVMIPTLLRDKCDFDAWELLFVAKILKASILGHSDLVEFYMNHISHQKKLDAAATVSPSSSSPATTPSASNLRQPSQSPALSPAATPTANGNHAGHSLSGGSSSSSSSSSTSSSASSCSSQTSSGTTATATTSSGWTTATSQQQQQQQQLPQSARSSLSSATSSTIQQQQQQQQQLESQDNNELVRELARTLSSPSMMSRQPQPPSLLQLTTTNNHIINRGSRGAIEQQLPTPVEGALSISTSSATANCRTPSTPTTPTSAGIISHHHHHHHHELKSSKSAGCLFRSNQSGASSPRLPPGTPTNQTTASGPQAETLGGQLQQLALGDPGAPVKLLLQIEQLKTSIVYVTNLLENVVELYRKSIDNIA